MWIGSLCRCTAVLVALFGAPLRRWWLRPRLSLQPDPEALYGDELTSTDDEYPKVQLVTLIVTNHGRGQADNMEAILTATPRVGPVDSDASPIPEFELPAVSRGAVRFELAPKGRARSPSRLGVRGCYISRCSIPTSRSATRY